MQDAKIIKSCANIVKKTAQIDAVIVVVSASGKTTERLIEIINICKQKKPKLVSAKLIDLEKNHRNIFFDLFSAKNKKDITEEWEKIFMPYFNKMKKILSGVGCVGDLTNKTYAYILSYGEKLSSLLMKYALSEIGIGAINVDSDKFIRTESGNYIDASCLLSNTKSLTKKFFNKILDSGVIPVVTGFFGKDTKGDITLLGRGASDYIAALIGSFVKAKEIQIWTDVNGIMSTDPRVVKNAISWLEVSSDLASEIAFAGAKVLHPRAVEVSDTYKRPVRVLNSFNPDFSGTIVAKNISAAENKIMGIAKLDGNVLINISNPNMLEGVGFINNIASLISAGNVPIDIFCTSETSVSFSIKGDDYDSKIDSLFSKIGNVKVIKKVSKIVVVANFKDSRFEVIAKIGSILSGIKVKEYAISANASLNNITIMIDESRSREAVERLHNGLIDV